MEKFILDEKADESDVMDIAIRSDRRKPDLKKETVRKSKCGIRRIGLQEVITII